ncbi:MAG: hypothetical protein ABTD50_16670 [Polyangiaceae bacterium]
MTRARSLQVSALLIAGLLALAVALWVGRPAAERRIAPTESGGAELPASPYANYAKEPVAPPDPPVAGTGVAAGPSSSPSPDASLDESSLMTQLRILVDVDPVRAYDLAKRGLALFPSSSNAPEIAALAVKSLARQGKRSEARGEAETMVNQYPGSPWAREVERHTGAHPHRDQTAP